MHDCNFSESRTPDRDTRTVMFTLVLRLDGGDSPRGSIGLPDQAEPLPFDGWVDFMSALNLLRAEAQAV
jgi:hypothetical protein